MLNQFVKAMKAEGLPDMLIRTFSSYYEALSGGKMGKINESDISAPQSESLVRYEDLESTGTNKLLKHIAVIKQNGG